MIQRIKRPLPLIITLVILAVFSLQQTGLLFKTPWFYINSTGSEPHGIYLSVPSGSIERGDKVVIRPPASMADYFYGRSWLEPGQTLLKTVWGLPGDTYTVTDQELKINGRYVGPVFECDSHGRSLPKLRGSFVVQEGYFLPLALSMPTSFDGRYFGEIPTAEIVTKVVPLVVF